MSVVVAPAAYSNDDAAPGPGRFAALVGVATSSAAVLVLEVVLTRVFAVSQFYHFAFLTVSLALLGFGASGSALVVFPGLGRGGPRRWAMLAVGQSLATIVGYGVANRIPFDSFSIAWDPLQVLYLAAAYIALAVPFLLGGLVIGTLLSGWDQPVSIGSEKVYAASLGGAGAGSLLALWGLGWVGGVGMIAIAAGLAASGAVAFATAMPGRRGRFIAASAALAVTMAVLALAPPEVLDLRLSPYKSLSLVSTFPDTEVVSTRWSAASRVDHVRSSSIRSLPGLSYAYAGQVPAQEGITFDGDDLSPIASVPPDRAEFVPFMLTSLPFALRSGGDALVLEPRGGLDVLVALVSGAESVTAVEPNPLAIEAIEETPGNVYGDSRVRLIIAEPRSFVERGSERFDVIDLALTAPYRPVTSGAYSLAEEYLLTVEAFEAYLDRLAPGGILAVLRWIQVPPSEGARLVAMAGDAAAAVGADPVEAVVAVRSYSNVLIMVKPDGFITDELASISSFAAEGRFDLVAAPGLRPEEANRYNVLPSDDYHPLSTALLRGADPGEVYDAFDITPPSDDHPFYGHYFRWAQTSDVLDTLGRTWQPFGGAGYFVLLAFLVLSAVMAVVLIALPLWVARLRHSGGRATAHRGHRLWTIAYFGLLGIGFLFVEIPLIQRYILLVGRPTVAVAVVLFALLLASGVGSVWSRRVPWRVAAVLLVALAVAYPRLIGIMTAAVLPLPLALRIVIGAMALGPLGFLMGTMFPLGVAHLEEVAPGLVPWAWGVNGTMSVVSAVAAALIALSAGFTAVLLAGAASYAGCALLTRRSASVSPRR